LLISTGGTVVDAGRQTQLEHLALEALAARISHLEKVFLWIDLDTLPPNKKVEQLHAEAVGFGLDIAAVVKEQI
jgi:hypothetical protein